MSPQPFVLCVIPARGGSSGVPGKNMRSLGGQPLMWHTFKAARESHRLSLVVVATESEEIANYAASQGVRVLRHARELSSDDAPTFPVIKQALERVRQEVDVDICVTLRVTSPLKTAQDIDNAVDRLVNTPSADSVISIVEAVGIHPVRLKRISADGYIQDAFQNEGNYPIRRQELERLYIRNGAIYASRRETIEAGGLWGPRSLPYVMPEERSININTEFQFRIAELLVGDGTLAR